MNHGIYSIYDRKAQYHLPLFSAQNDTTAIRMFTETVVTSETPVSTYPADFDLVRVGTVDLELGAIEPHTRPEPIVNGLVALETAHRERSRYQAILQPQNVAESSPEAS